VSGLIGDLRQARLDQGLTQADVADAAGLPRTTVKDMEAHVCTPLLSTVERERVTAALGYALSLRRLPAMSSHDIAADLAALTDERFGADHD